MFLGFEKRFFKTFKAIAKRVKKNRRMGMEKKRNIMCLWILIKMKDVNLVFGMEVRNCEKIINTVEMYPVQDDEEENDMRKLRINEM